jgi:hypothetical protein
VQVGVDVEIGPFRQMRRKIGGNRLRVFLRRAAGQQFGRASGQPQEQRTLHRQQHREQRDETQRDAPIEAAIPDDLGHGSHQGSRNL